MNTFFVAAVAVLPVFALRAAAPLLETDLAQPSAAAGWKALHHIASLQPAPGGLQAVLAGPDPYLAGPPADYPPGQALWLSLRLKSDQGGAGQVFFFRDGTVPSEEASVRFNAPAGEWHEARMPLPPLGPGFRFRIDPPGDGGKVLIDRIRVDRRVLLAAPAWPAPAPLDTHGARWIGDPALQAGLAPGGGFRLRVEGADMGRGYDNCLIGYLSGETLRWFSPGPLKTSASTPALQSAQATDPDGAQWTLTRSFAPGTVPGTLDIETRVTVSQDRSVLFLPMLIVLPGAGAFGTNKDQGLFAGLEYLDNEPSSSQADLRGPESHRQTPAAHKITFPLMAVQARDRYLGLAWEAAPECSALFDSPDRLFGGGGHVMGVIFPGSDGVNRIEGSLLPYSGTTLAAGKPRVLRARLLGGRGRSVVDAVRHYVRLHGWPALPDPGFTLEGYSRLAARGWLDSSIRQGALFRHAVWDDLFHPGPAADASMCMDWLALTAGDPALAERLRQTAAAARQAIPPERLNSAAVSHVRSPAPSLVYRGALQNAAAAAARARQQLARFEPDGAVLYHKPASGPDYGSTHFSRQASGLAGQAVCTLLEDAVFSGDRPLIEEALQRLRALGRFDHTVPRGAQTWEIPLHTPDILGSAYLARAFTLGYQLTGEAPLLEQAVYWAWTGVPFVYLTPPSAGPIGVYSTIAVYGATGWVAPVWMGMPVQWCGMVYADALNRLAPHDPQTPWRQIADGISAAGVQITWPATDLKRGGLLPDGFEPVPQRRGGPAINPATVQAGAVRLYGRGPLCDFHAFRALGWLVHAPGEIVKPVETAEGVRFEARVWPDQPCQILVSGLSQPPKITLNGQPAALTAPHQYEPATGRLALEVTGPAIVELGR